MATARKKPVNAGLLTKEPTEAHEGLAAYITKTTGREVDGATVALVQRAYPLYAKSPEVAKAREAEKAKREAEAARKQAEKEARLKERLAKIEEQRQRVLAELGLDDVSEPPVLTVVEEPEPEEEPEVVIEDDEDEDVFADEDDDVDDEEDF